MPYWCRLPHLGLLGGPTRPERRWRGTQRWRFTTLWRSYRAALWGTEECRSLWTPSADDWLKQAHTIIAITNAALAAVRAEEHLSDLCRPQTAHNTVGETARSPIHRGHQRLAADRATTVHP